MRKEPERCPTALTIFRSGNRAKLAFDPGVSYHFFKCSIRLMTMSRQRSSKRVRRSLVAIPALLFIACQTVPSYAQNDETSQPVLPITSPDQVEYRYDTAAGECRNAAGKKGTNGRLLAPCGDLTAREPQGIRSARKGFDVVRCCVAPIWRVSGSMAPF